MKRWVVLSVPFALAAGLVIELLDVVFGDGFQLDEVAFTSVVFLALFVLLDLHGRIKGAWPQALSFGLGAAAVVVFGDIVHGNSIVGQEIALFGMAACVLSLLLSWGEDWAERHRPRGLE
jgi:hypothetical protein